MRARRLPGTIGVLITAGDKGCAYAFEVLPRRQRRPRRLHAPER
jgi:hypothetical protein